MDYPPHLPHRPQPEYNPYSATKEPLLTNAAHAREEAKSKRPWLKVLLFSLPVVIGAVGLAVFLLVFIFLISSYTIDGLFIETTADLQNLLTISQILATFVSRSVPIVVTVHAYQLASKWLKSSDGYGPDRPSPLQLGMLVSVLQGANILTWLKARLYIGGLTKDAKRQRLPSPPLLVRAVFVLGLLLLTSNLAAILDTLLHATSKAFVVSQSGIYPSNQPTNYGMQINQTQCAESNLYNLCGLIIGGNNAYLPGTAAGLQVLSNASDSMVVYTEDQHAIIVPVDLPTDATYVASTVGVHSSCMSITKQCLPTGGSYGPEAFVNWDCTGSPTFYINSTALGSYSMPGESYPTFGVVNTTTGILSGYNPATQAFTAAYEYAKTNPFPIGAIVQSIAYFGTDDTFIGNTGFFSHGHDAGFNILYCNTTVKNVQYRYTSSSTLPVGTFETISTTLADMTTTMRIAGTIELGVAGNYIAQRVEGTGLKSGNYVNAYALELSRELMALSGILWAPSPVTSIQANKQVLGSKVNMVPLALFVGMVFVYAILTIWVAIIAIGESSSTPYVHLAHMRITSPLAYVHALFGPVDAPRTWKKDGFGLFSIETDSDRLNVGAVTTMNGEMAFGVQRGASPAGAGF